jgi:hypothetical protein
MPKKYDPNTYETVKSRKEKFYKEHADGRIVVEMIDTDKCMDYALFKASVYLSQEDQLKSCPRGVGYALEVRDKVMPMGKNGAYESVNYTSWTENCEESAVGRALDNAGYSGNKKPSLEEMAKASRMASTMSTYNQPPAVHQAEQTAKPEMATPNQIKFIQSLQDQGKVARSVNPFTLTKQSAIKVIGEATDSLPVKTIEQ